MAKLMAKFRWWIVKKLVGKAPVMANLSVVAAEPIELPPNSHIWGNHVELRG